MIAAFFFSLKSKIRFFSKFKSSNSHFILSKQKTKAKSESEEEEEEEEASGSGSGSD